MPETLTDAQKVLRNDTGKRIAVALEALASEIDPSTVIAPEYDETQTYAVGDLVMYRGVLYRCTAAITTPEAWTAAHWTATSVSDEYRQAVDQNVIDANLMALGLTGASVGDLVRVAAVDPNGKPTSWQKAPLCDIVTNPNLLDNWYFVGGGSQLGDGVFPINQRGQASYQGAVFGIDRWYVTSGSSSQVTIDTDGIIYKNTAATNRISQHAPISLAGKTVTLSARCTAIDGTRYAVTIQTNAGNSTTTFTTDEITSVTFTVPSAATEINAQIRIEDTGASVKIHAMKLELGSYQTLARNEGTEENPDWVLNELPDYGEELAKCQRYFQTFRTEALRPTYGADCRPLMAADEPTKGTITIDGVTYYTLTA